MPFLSIVEVLDAFGVGQTQTSTLQARTNSGELQPGQTVLPR